MQAATEENVVGMQSLYMIKCFVNLTSRTLLDREYLTELNNSYLL